MNEDIASNIWPTPVGDWRPKHLSYSAVSKFGECEYAYWLSYVKGRRSPSNKGMLVGSLFGKMIEEAHAGRAADWSRLKRFHGSLPFADREKIAEADLKTIWDLFNLYAPDGVPPYTGTPEKKLLVYLPDREAVPYQILGYMDLERPEDNAISEFKTSAWINHPEWGWNQEKVDNSDQAAVYWYAYGLEYSREPDEVRFHILGTKAPLSYFELVTHPNMDRLLKFQDKAAALCRAIEEERFEETCGKCPKPKGA